MPLYHTESVGNVSVALWHVTEDSKQLFLLAAECGILQMCVDAVAGMTTEKRCRERIATRLALCMLGMDRPIHYAQSGRPLCDGQHISISHTGEWVAVAVSRVPVGVDVELRSDKALRVALRFINEREESMVVGGERSDVATAIWSAKESMFKLVGEDDVNFLRHLCIENMSGDFSSEFIFTARELRTDECRSCRVVCKMYPDFVLTMATYTD